MVTFIRVSKSQLMFGGVRRQHRNGSHKIFPVCSCSRRPHIWYAPPFSVTMNQNHNLLRPIEANSRLPLAQCDGPTTNIQNSGDATALNVCKTITGDVVISPNAAGSIALNGVQQITGDLTCQNAGQLTSLSSDQLTSIGGTFGLSNLTILSTLQMNSLKSVKNIEWVSLPALQGLNFNQGVTQAQSVVISNTQLNTLTGVELDTIGSMDINNNPYLNTVNVNNLANVTQSLSFAANSKTLEISFPNLESAANLTFRNASAVTMPSLAKVNGSLGFFSNTFQSFAAPNLTSTGGSLAFVDSPGLTNLSFPQLTQVGGAFLVANNTNLTSIDGFANLGVIVGALDFAGSFDRCVTLTTLLMEALTVATTAPTCLL